MQVIIGSEFTKKVIPLIEQAKNTIDIMVYDWRYYPQDPSAHAQLFNQAIIDAKKRGVKVRAVINNTSILNYLTSNQIEVKTRNDTKLVHCKFMIIDEKICIAGSHNYTQNAFQLNLEVSIAFEINTETIDILKYFQNIWQR